MSLEIYPKQFLNNDKLKYLIKKNYGSYDIFKYNLIRLKFNNKINRIISLCVKKELSNPYRNLYIDYIKNVLNNLDREKFNELFMNELYL